VRIAVCGTHGIGKTTLVDALHTHYVRESYNTPPFWGRIEEVARTVALDLKLKTLSDILSWPTCKVEYFQWLCAMRQVTEEYNEGSFISDRSFVDIIAYTVFYGCSYTMVEALMDFAEQHVPTYDILFYAPVPLEFEETSRADGFRLTDKKSAQDVDSLIDNLLQQNYVNICLPQERSQWFSFCCEEIEKEWESIA
jgi:thymidylate kinase